MIVTRSRTMRLQSPTITIGGTVLKEADDLVILGVTFDSKMTLEKYLRSVSRAASQRRGILRESEGLASIQISSWEMLVGSVIKLLDRVVSAACFFNKGCV